MTHLDFPANQESPIGDALRRIRLRFDVPRWVGAKWVHVSVKQRLDNHARELASAKRRDWHPKRWQPDHGRESPREDWMSWRRSMISYAYPGWMRYYHGRAQPLVGRALLYCPFPEPVFASCGATRKAESHMSDTAFEWFDPYEEKQRADREARRADQGIATGRNQVESAIARATKNHLSEKLEAAVAGLAEKIAHRVAFDFAVKGAYRDICERQGAICAEAFRDACRDIFPALELPDHVRVRTRVGVDLITAEESFTLEYETLRPIRIAHRFNL